MAYSQSEGVELQLPKNIHELIENSLLEATDLNVMHPDTLKFYVAGYPELFVRLNEGNPPLVVERSVEATRKLREYGLAVPPLAIVDHEGDAYIFTKKVNGESLDVVLENDCNAVPIDELDTVWKGLALNLIKQREEGGLVPDDVDHPHQYMYGTIPGEDSYRVWLVDIGTFIINPRNVGDYAQECLFIAGGIIETEKRVKTSLLAARESLQLALSDVPTDSSWEAKLGRATNYVLEELVVLYPSSDEDFIDDTF